MAEVTNKQIWDMLNLLSAKIDKNHDDLKNDMTKVKTDVATLSGKVQLVETWKKDTEARLDGMDIVLKTDTTAEQLKTANMKVKLLSDVIIKQEMVMEEMKVKMEREEQRSM